MSTVLSQRTKVYTIVIFFKDNIETRFISQEKKTRNDMTVLFLLIKCEYK